MGKSRPGGPSRPLGRHSRGGFGCGGFSKRKLRPFGRSACALVEHFGDLVVRVVWDEGEVLVFLGQDLFDAGPVVCACAAQVFCDPAGADAAVLDQGEAVARRPEHTDAQDAQDVVGGHERDFFPLVFFATVLGSVVASSVDQSTE